jgi:hypothetical protein
MNPVTVELLNRVEKYRRSKQVEACQLLNQAQAGRSSRPSLRERVMHGLGTLLTRRRSAAERASDQAAA